MHKIVKAIVYRIKDLSRLLFFWKPDFIWLYKNRFLRMDANEPINDERRRFFHKDRYEFAANYLKDMKKDDLFILDAACGTGYGSDILKKAHPQQIIGIDICQKTVAYANKKYGNRQCIFKTCDITDLKDFMDEMFDSIVSFETIEHIEHPIVFLNNLNRVLKKEGILIISTPNKWGLTKDHKFDYDYELLRDHLERFFDIEDIYVQNSGCMELWTNRGAPRRLLRATTPENIEQAECFIAIAKKH